MTSLYQLIKTGAFYSFEPFIKQLFKFLLTPIIVDGKQWELAAVYLCIWTPFSVWYLFWWSCTSISVLGFEEFTVVKYISKNKLSLGSCGPALGILSLGTDGWGVVCDKKAKQNKSYTKFKYLEIFRPSKAVPLVGWIVCLFVVFCFSRWKITFYACEDYVGRASWGHDFVFYVSRSLDHISHVSHVLSLYTSLKNL